jgi:hypothetical protein
VRMRKFSTLGDIALRPLGRFRLVYGLDAIENLAEIALCDLNVIVVLQVEPKLCGCPERLGEPKRSIGGNAGLFAGDPLDPRARQGRRPWQERPPTFSAEPGTPPVEPHRDAWA